MVTHDLQVQAVSNSLAGWNLDLVVSGSIGAVESVRFIRALRRLGAEVYPTMTQAAGMFTTPTALSWAAARPVTQNFDGSASHIALRDACIVAPASANMISKVAQGITDSPATALIASYLGQKKPVFFVPNMHDSLLHSPLIASNWERLKSFVHALEPRVEEGKQKFPDPATLADEVSHRLRFRKDSNRIMLTMGTTRGYIDSVRYVSNYSSGALGSRIAEEFYRNGFAIHVISGPSPIQPRVFSQKTVTETHEEMAEAVTKASVTDLSGAIFAASVLDFVPTQRIARKIRSSEELAVQFTKTSKIISILPQPLPFKVGFKLESELTTDSPGIARDYLQRYQLSHLILNEQGAVTESTHKAYAYTNRASEPSLLESKELIARYLVQEAERACRKNLSIECETN